MLERDWVVCAGIQTEFWHPVLGFPTERIYLRCEVRIFQKRCLETDFELPV